ncbi:uncharacterized protein J3R85_016929 [Psidium guajava]|nr:uncharacterized protein J3R85_016929 [Psidium guajava]
MEPAEASRGLRASGSRGPRTEPRILWATRSLPAGAHPNSATMASFLSFKAALPKLFLALCLLQMSSATRRLAELVQDQSPPMRYHNGPLLSGKISVNLIWYGSFKPSQRTIVSDFVSSLSSDSSVAQAPPSVSRWWKTVDKYYHLSSSKRQTPSLALSLGRQVLDEGYSLGKSLTSKHLVELASRGEPRNAVNIVLTSSDVAVEGFCMSRCGSHGSAVGSGKVNGRRSKFAYIWVGNSETQCPGQCAWPFHQPMYGPQSPPLVAPNGDVGVDGMVINLAGLLAGTATNPFSNGYYQGEAGVSLEAARRGRATTRTASTGGSTWSRLSTIRPRRPVRRWCEGNGQQIETTTFTLPDRFIHLFIVFSLLRIIAVTVIIS